MKKALKIIFLILFCICLLITTCFCFISINVSNGKYISGKRIVANKSETEFSLYIVKQCLPNDRQSIKPGDLVIYTDRYIYKDVEYADRVMDRVSDAQDGFLYFGDGSGIEDFVTKKQTTDIEEIVQTILPLPMFMAFLLGDMSIYLSAAFLLLIIVDIVLLAKGKKK